MGTPTNPDVGDRVFDGSEFTYLQDLKPKELIGLRPAQEGQPAVLAEIAANQASSASRVMTRAARPVVRVTSKSLAQR